MQRTTCPECNKEISIEPDSLSPSFRECPHCGSTLKSAGAHSIRLWILFIFGTVAALIIVPYFGHYLGASLLPLIIVLIIFLRAKPTEFVFASTIVLTCFIISLLQAYGEFGEGGNNSVVHHRFCKYA